MSEENTVYYPGCKGIWYSEPYVDGQLDYVLYLDKNHYCWGSYDDILSENPTQYSRNWALCCEDETGYFLPTASLILPMEFIE